MKMFQVTRSTFPVLYLPTPTIYLAVEHTVPTALWEAIMLIHAQLLVSLSCQSAR